MNIDLQNPLNLDLTARRGEQFTFIFAIEDVNNPANNPDFVGIETVMTVRAPNSAGRAVLVIYGNPNNTPNELLFTGSQPSYDGYEGSAVYGITAVFPDGLKTILEGSFMIL